MTVRTLLQDKGNFVSLAEPDASVQNIIDQLERDETAAVVVSPDGKVIDGIVSNGSIVQGMRRFGSELPTRCVRDLMTQAVITCDIDEPITKIYQLMDTHQIRHVPITDEGKLCGIIHLLDVVKYRLKEIDAEAQALKDYVAGRA
ncbi:CBS domain-containing protein [Notoacmeibacter marinus]|uniref:CBS domain-containing protein n=1 Tax=Notoacmeibacter marinus TaxID=1876515 RepID=UPI0013B04F77|nr:CBS domain-containing protein [Notoacmeibacter marinus]